MCSLCTVRAIPQPSARRAVKLKNPPARKGRSILRTFSRGGSRRLAVRTAMEHPIGALPRTPFPASRDFAPVGSMSLDFQVASLSYKSSSFATSRGNEKICGTGYCVTYDTESQSRNAPCVPFRGRGPRSGEGMYEGKNDYDTLILYLIALRSGGRRLAVRAAMEHPIGTLPRTPFCLFEAFPLKGKRGIWREKQGVIYFMYHSGVSPFGGWRHHLPPGGGTLFFAMR